MSKYYRNYFMDSDNTRRWYQNNKRHREDGPAVIYSNGNQEWYQNGKLHREDGPAIISNDGTQFWYQNGKQHREDGPAFIGLDGTQIWRQNGKHHREDGPVIIRSNGYKAWYQNDKLHREDGPAIVYPSSSDQTFYFQGREVTEEWINKYQKLIKKHTLLGIPVRDKWRVREIVLSWYYNPKLKFVKNRLEREYKELYN